MSTRANVLFIDHFSRGGLKTILENGEILGGMECIQDAPNVYVHSDMYPSGAIPMLHKFLNLDGADARGSDAEYLSAWYVAYMITNNICYNLPYESDRGEDFYTKSRGRDDIEACRDFTGVGISKCIHGDVSYIYLVEYKTGTQIAVPYFEIHVFDGNGRYIDTVNTIDKVEKFEDKGWWC